MARSRPEVPKGKWYRCVGIVTDHEDVDSKEQVWSKILEILQNHYSETVEMK